MAQTRRYCSNTEVCQDPELTEGVDYGRRHRRHELFDDSLDQRPALARTTIAPTGGGIETGTSELCLAVAGYHPATLAVTPPGGPTYHYWMFDGLRPANNTVLVGGRNFTFKPYLLEAFAERRLDARDAGVKAINGDDPARGRVGPPLGPAATSPAGRSRCRWWAWPGP